MTAAATPFLVLSTASSAEEAERLARALVGERLAACVNVVPGVRSVYRWRGEVEAAGELLLLIKTARDRLDALRLRLRQLHGYELPEIVYLEVSGGDADYLAWVVGETRPG